MLDLKALKVFLTVADLASMTAAAKRLDLSQSAVSQAIRQLEEHVGAVLVDRERRPLALTAAGAALRERGAALVAEAESVYKSIREQAGSEAQLLRLGMVDSFAATIGPALLTTLLPSTVHLRVASGLSPGLGAALVARELDMIVTTDPPDGAGALERHRLLTEPFVLLMPRSLAQALRAPTLAALAAAAPLVRFNVESHIGVAIERYLHERDVVPPNRLQIDTADCLVAMVAEGIGWALVTPLCLLQARAASAACVAAPLPGPPLARDITLVARKGEYGALPQRMAATVTQLVDREWRPTLARIAPWLADAVVTA
ncbi:MAG: LysR family transcriptional regulator [Burkholderiales bacterium]|nr:LysR family transcriptional regulator [Burkholderiales bacterium]